MSRVVTFDERTVQDFALFRTVERACACACAPLCGDSPASRAHACTPTDFAEFCRIGLQFLQQGMKRGLLTQAAGAHVLQMARVAQRAAR